MGSSTYILRVLILWFEGHSDTEWQGSAVKIQSWSNWSPPVFTLMMCWYLPSNTWEALERGRVQAADSTLLWWEYKYELHHMPRSHVTCLLSSLVSLVLYHPFWSFLAVCRLLSIILQKPKMHRITGRAEPSIGQLGGRGIFSSLPVFVQWPPVTGW